MGLRQTTAADALFSNIRIFVLDSETTWAGNIYALDLLAETGDILIDRIQMPRYLPSKYIQFFEHLRTALETMFVAVDYRYLLMPITISNNDTIQEVYNGVRKQFKKIVLPTKGPVFASSNTQSFESLRQGPHYYVFSEKSVSPDCPEGVGANEKATLRITGDQADRCEGY